jgi:hypothetical protein
MVASQKKIPMRPSRRTGPQAWSQRQREYKVTWGASVGPNSTDGRDPSEWREGVHGKEPQNRPLLPRKSTLCLLKLCLGLVSAATCYKHLTEATGDESTRTHGQTPDERVFPGPSYAPVFVDQLASRIPANARLLAAVKAYQTQEDGILPAGQSSSSLRS